MILLMTLCCLVSFIVNALVGGALLHGAVRLFRIGSVRYRRCIWIVLVASLVLVPISVISFAVRDRWPYLQVPLAVGELGLWFGVLTAMLRSKLGRTLLAGTFVLATNFAFSWAVALGCRAWLFEAFSVPTGSMACTILGEHVSRTCPRCGFQYVTAVSGFLPPRLVDQAVCPNCMNRSTEQSQSLVVEAGDRLVADKLSTPHRWQVVVVTDPTTPGVSYVKRLVGLPGEFVEIIQGDIYTASFETIRSKEPGLCSEAERLRHDLYQYGHGQSDMTLQDVADRYGSINKNLTPYLRIQRKVLAELGSQEFFWVPVIDQTFVPAVAAATTQPQFQVGWMPTSSAAGAAWNTNGRELRFQSEDNNVLAVEFSGVTISDALAYNGAQRWSAMQPVPVGDVRLSFEFALDSGKGGLVLRMNRDQDTFEARLTMNGTAEISHESGASGTHTLVGRARFGVPESGKSISIQFQNLDFRVSLSVDGREVIASTDEQYTPNVADLLTRADAASKRLATHVQIGGYDLHCQLRHLRIDRDTYYRSLPMLEPRSMAPPHLNGPVGSNPFYGWPGWGTQGWPIMLRDGPNSECFLLGDNSGGAKDCRLWWETGPHLASRGEGYQWGTLPMDQIIGVARFIYWPPARWHRLD